MRNILTAVAALSLSFSLAACASGGGREPDVPAGPISFTEAAGQPANDAAKFYADCIAQSALQSTYDRDGGLIRFRCNDAPAKALYDALGAHAAAIGAEHVDGKRTIRATQKLMRDVSGRDYCWQEQGEHTLSWGCTLVFNAGTFVTK